VVEPENSWTWDSAIFGALQERGFEVEFGAVPAAPASLSRYDLIALSIKRYLTPEESANLERYVADGGAVYGSWGGPISSPAFLQRVCKVSSTGSLRLGQFSLLSSPLTKGIGDEVLALRPRVGHRSESPEGWEMVAVQPLEGGVPVAQDAAGNVLGVLSTYASGRAAVLGFGPEQEKHFAKPELGPLMLDNLLAWLLEDKLRSPDNGWSGSVTIALPARAEIREVYLNGQRVPVPVIKRVGSLKKVILPVAGIGPGREASVRVTYANLPKGRNVETVIHLPWATLRAAAKSPGRLAEYLRSLGATTAQPLLRGSFGEAWYEGMPQDRQDEALVGQYHGNFLADFLSECHTRGIKVIGGVYFDNAEPVRAYPEVTRLDRKGNVARDRYGRPLACFNNPKGQEHTLATITQLLQNYNLDGVVLDDNFELDKEECCCAYCKEALRKHCEAKGIPYPDLALSDRATAAEWRQHRREATRLLAAKVRGIARAHGVPAGGWVGAGMDATHLREAFDFLGGMVYTEPPRAAWGPLSVLGDCGFTCLLWAPGSDPQAMVQEVRDAVHAGCATVGFWIRGDDGGYEMDPQRSEAMRSAFRSVDDEWLAFYRDSILSGDRRFVVLEGTLGTGNLTLKLKNTGKSASSRLEGRLDLAVLQTRP
jgi:hypothetical protein